MSLGSLATTDRRSSKSMKALSTSSKQPPSFVSILKRSAQINSNFYFPKSKLTWLPLTAARYIQIKENIMNRKLISSGSEFESKIGYSRAVVDGDYVFVSGTTGYDYESMTISDTVVEQADQCFKNIEKALIEAGSCLDQVVRVHYIFPNKSDFELCWPIFKKYLGKVRPAATMFVAGLLNEKMKLEIEVTARVGNT